MDFLQRGVLATGLMNPEVEASHEGSSGSHHPDADFNLKLVSSEGERVSMEQFRGQVVFLNIWATWCPPCIAEMPGVNSLYNDVKDQDVVFIMLSVDEDFEKALRFRDRKGYDFEVYQVDGGIPRMYYTQTIPTTFVIDANGELVFTHTGMANYNTSEFRGFLSTLVRRR